MIIIIIIFIIIIFIIIIISSAFLSRQSIWHVPDQRSFWSGTV